MSRAIVVAFFLSGSLTAPAAAKCPVPAGPDLLKPSRVVATVGGQKIRVKEVDQKAADALCTARIEYQRKLEEIRRGTLEGMVNERLIENEAKKRKLTVPGLLAAEVESVPAPTDDEARAFYMAYQARIQGSYDDVKAEIIDALHQQTRQAALQALVEALRKARKVSIDLPPLRMPVEAKGPSKGPEKAPVTVVVFSDFECPYCAQGVKNIDAVQAKYGDKVRVVYRDYPLGFHERAIPAAVAARCADAQGKFWPMHDRLYAHQQQLGDDQLRAHAQAVGLDLAAYDACFADPKHVQAVRADMADGDKVGVNGTPAYFINGVSLSGALPVEQISAVVDRELAARKK